MKAVLRARGEVRQEQKKAGSNGLPILRSWTPVLDRATRGLWSGTTVVREEREALRQRSMVRRRRSMLRRRRSMLRRQRSMVRHEGRRASPGELSVRLQTPKARSWTTTARDERPTGAGQRTTFVHEPRTVRCAGMTARHQRRTTHWQTTTTRKEGRTVRSPTPRVRQGGRTARYLMKVWPSMKTAAASMIAPNERRSAARLMRLDSRTPNRLPMASVPPRYAATRKSTCG